MDKKPEEYISVKEMCRDVFKTKMNGFTTKSAR